MGRLNGKLSATEAQKLLRDLMHLPSWIEKALEIEDEVKELARELMHSQDFLYLGRGINYPIALEGALKLKEISYIHAEGYPAGEMKHGPIALIDEKMPVVVLAPRDRYFQKTVSNLKEVESRGGKVVVLTDDAKTTSEMAGHRVLTAAQSFALSYADRDDDSAAVAGLLHRGAPRHGRRSTAQSRQKRHGRIMALFERGSVNFARTTSSLQHRDFRLLFFGTSLSHVGDFIQAMAQSWLVWTMTGSPFLLGVVGFCQALPRLLLGAVGGAIVDRIERRRLLMSTQILAMLQAFVFWALVYFDGIQFWHVIILVLFLGTVNTINQTARHSLINSLVPRERSHECHRAQFLDGQSGQDRRAVARRRADQRDRRSRLFVCQRREFSRDHRDSACYGFSHGQIKEQR